MNKAVAQLTDLFRSMTPGARITAGLLLTVVVVSVAYLFNSGFSGPDTLLLGGKSFSDEEMQAIQVAFGAAQLNNWDTKGMQIRIPRGQQDLYLAAMAKGNALPQEFGNEFQALLNDDNMFATDRHWHEKRAIVQETRLAKIICRMEGIEQATVAIHEDKNRSLTRSPKRTATVSAWPRGGQDITSENAMAFRQLVAGACDMELRNISVLNGKTGQTIAAMGSETAGGAGNALFAAKQSYEQSYRDRALEALSFVRGVVVSTEVMVSPEAHSSEETVKVDKGNTTPITTSEQSTESTSQAGGPGGQPGLEANSTAAANGQTAVTVAPTRQTATNDNTSRTETTNAVPHTTTRTEIAGFVAQSVNVAVSVPEDYFIRVWRNLNPVPDGQTPTPPSATDLAPIIASESTKIKNHVETLLPPPPEGSTTTNLVTVSPFTSVPAEAAPAASFLDGALGWLAQSWSTLALFLLAGFGLMTLRSLTRGIPIVESSAAASGAPALAIAPETIDDAVAGEPGAKQQPTAPRLKRRGPGGPSLREELSEIVREDPDAAANVLRAWIGNAS